MYDLDMSHDLRRGTEPVARLAGDEQRARAALDAFRAAARASHSRGSWASSSSWTGASLLASGCAPGQAETGQDVGHEFATAFARLAAEPERLDRLGKSVVAVDERAFCAEVEEVGLQRVCLQLCHWVCGWIREAFSECVCADAQQQAWLR